MNLKAFLAKIKYETAVFAVLLTQLAVRIDWSNPVDSKFFTFYLLDFKVGFVSQAFIGSIVSLLTDRPSAKWLTGFILISVMSAYFVLSLFLGRIIRKADSETRNNVIFAAIVFLLTSFSVRVFPQYLGLPDIYLFLFTLLALACMRNKVAKWFVPFLCFLGFMVHIEFAFTFLPLILLILIYNIIAEENRLKASILASACFITASASAVYFAVFANRHLRMDSSGVYAYLSSKTDIEVWRRYYEGHLFYTDTVSGQKFSGLLDSLKVFKETGLESVSASNYLTSFFMMLPLLLLFLYIWKNACKESSRKSEKFIFVLCAALPVPVLPAFIFSTDMSRFLGEIFIVQFMAFFYMVFVKNQAVILSIKKVKIFFKIHPVILMLFIIFSLSAFFAK